MSVLEDVRASIRARRDELKPLADEYGALEQALAALGGLVAEEPTRPTRRDPRAPYGRKADGSPRKRPGRRANIAQEPPQPQLTPYERAKAAAENGV
jgi:hypothetical protein